jgi:tryptophan aminotransferase
MTRPNVQADVYTGMISLLAGKPNPETFPIESVVINLLPLNGKTPLPLTIEGSDLQTSLQYSATAGLPRLVKFLEGFQSHVHGRDDPQTEGWRVTVVSLSSGSEH